RKILVGLPRGGIDRPVFPDLGDRCGDGARQIVVTVLTGSSLGGKLGLARRSREYVERIFGGVGVRVACEQMSGCPVVPGVDVRQYRVVFKLIRDVEQQAQATGRVVHVVEFIGSYAGNVRLIAIALVAVDAKPYLEPVGDRNIEYSLAAPHSEVAA